MLRSANEAYLDGRRIEAAAKLREALRRFLAARCASNRLDKGGDVPALLERLRGSGVTVDVTVDDVLYEVEEVLTLRSRGNCMAFALELAFEVIGTINRKGGAL